MTNLYESFSRVVIFVMILLALTSCRQSSPVPAKVDLDQIVVRLQIEPESLSPILAESSQAREAYQYLYLNLANYDYQTLELKPVLIKEIPDGTLQESGSNEGYIAYDMQMRDEAVWTDGSPVTGHDVVTTYKIASHPGVESPAWKQLLGEIKDVVVDEDNPKSFTIYASDSYFLNKEALLSAEIYPRYIFDSDGALDNISLDEVKNAGESEQLLNDAAFENVARDFSSVEYNKVKPDGAGPYYLEKWETGQYLVLKRKENYWGQKFGDIDQLQTYPDRIVFQIIKDETTALTLLKNDEIDLIDFSRVPVAQYEALKSDPDFSNKHVFANAQLQRFYYLILNNEDERLADLSVRQAIGRLVDTDRMMDQLEGGYGTKSNSIIHFSKPEYNKDLPFINYNPDEAISILESAGWTDSDGNGVRDKVINGRKEELSFRFHITGSFLSSSVSNIVKEACSNAGIEINIIEKPWPPTRSENLATGDFDMLVSARTQSPVKDDPYIYYHSTSVGKGGANYVRYSSPEADKYMETIRTTKDETIRRKAYMDLQKVIFEDEPVVFIYSPQLRIIHDKNISPVISSKRPGYFVNLDGTL